MADQPENAPFEHPIEVERLRANTAFVFDITPNEAEADAIREALGLRGMRKMRFQGEIEPLDKRGWRVKGLIGVSITQDCVITLEPVKTRIDSEVSLRFLPESMIEYDTPEDVLEDDIEPLGPVIDLGHVALEALGLAIPGYPRSESAQAAQLSAAPPGAAPITDADVKPFAGLADLRSKLDSDKS
ncbi:MAG: DUF177 domain-containing protein [Rhodobacteraceae bacterium]|nr:DUF177 domain-containing protein [Paracoccaceae bacterium]